MAGGNLSSSIDSLVKEVHSFRTDVTDKIVTSNDIQSLMGSLQGVDTNIQRLADKIEEVNNYLGSGHISGGQMQSPNLGATAQNVSGSATSSNSPLTKIENYLNGILTQLTAFAKAYSSNKSEDILKVILSPEKLAEHYKALEKKTERQDKNIFKQESLESAKDVLRNKNSTKEDRKNALKTLRDNEKEEKRLERRLKYGGGRGVAFGVEKVTGIGSSIAKGVKADDVVGAVTGMLSKAGPWGAAAGGVLQLLKGLFDLYAKQDKLASQYVREVGGGKTGKNEIFARTTDWLNKNATWTNGYDNEELLTTAREIAEANGRSINKLSDLSLKSGIDLKRMGIGADAINNFDTFGKSIHETDKYFAKLYGEVSSKGLSFKNVSQEVNKNLKLAQSHTFSTGLRGLERMAERSVQLKYNMQQVATLADKVSTLEGALQASASLNVLGGSFAQFGNPLQMMYEGLNDMESLNERMIGMFGDLSFWDNSKQQMDISAFDKQRVRAAATAMGIDPNEMISMSLNNGKMKRIEGQIGSGLDNKTIEYIKNLAELDENGNAKLTLNGQEKYVSELTNNDREALKNESEAKAAKEGATLGDVWQGTMGIGDKLDNILKYLTTKLGIAVFKIAGFGGGFGGTEKRAYFQNHKEELIKKYGSREKAKLAISMGQEDEAIRNYYGGEEGIKKYKEGSRIHIGDNGQIAYIETRKNYAKRIHESMNGTEPISVNNSSKNANIASQYTIQNSPSNSNPINTTPVASKQSTAIAQNFSQNNKMDLSVNINGKLDLTSGSSRGQIDLNKLSESDKQKIVEALLPEILKQENVHKNKGYHKTSIS